jgi:hypothetical protein
MLAVGRPGKNTYKQRGMVLVEATVTLSIIAVIGIVLLKLSLNILHPRQMILQQTLADAYLTYERAYAERIPFEEMKGASTPWPLFPATSTIAVEIGKRPGGYPVTATIIRTRIPDTNNYPIAGGTGTDTTNPSAMEVWNLQSILTYEVSGRSYASSRTVIRTQ